MRRIGEHGMSSLVGLAMLGVMLLAAAGLFAIERNETYATQRYEDEVRLRLAARSWAECKAIEFEKGGKRAENADDDIVNAPDKKLDLGGGETADGISYHAVAYFERGVRSGKDELVVSATAQKESRERRFPVVKRYMRARAHLTRSQEGKHYVWLGWVP